MQQNDAQSGLPDVPVLEASFLRGSGAAHVRELERLRNAAESWGFFELRGHGVAPERIRRLFHAQRAFFDQPLDAKRRLQRSARNARGYNPAELTKNRVDAKEILDFGHKPDPEAADDAPQNRVADGWNQMPDDPEIRAALWDWYGACESLAFEVYDWLRSALGVSPEPRHASERHTSFLRLNLYPDTQRLAALPGRDADAQASLGIHHHTDAGLLTLLIQDGPPALQVWHEGDWRLVDPLPDSFIVNTGDMLQVMSNDRFPAPVHRVLASADGAPRCSAAYFFNPPYDQHISPLPPENDPGSADGFRPAYRTFTWEEFRSRRAAGDYADLGEEVQISHYRT